MYCTNCGKEIGDGARFCINCGTAVRKLKAQQTEEQDTYQQQEVPQTEEQSAVRQTEALQIAECTATDKDEIGSAVEEISQSEADVYSYIYQPLVASNEVWQLDRQTTMDVLAEALLISEEWDKYNSNISSLKAEIDKEQKEAEDIRKKPSDSAVRIVLIVSIVSAIVGTFIIPIIMTAIFGLAAAGILYVTVIKEDIKQHAPENNEKADTYIREHVVPLQMRLDENLKYREAWINSGKYEWVVDIVGKDLFYSNSIKCLYDLVQSRRADSLKEALNKYDDMLHKARMEEMQQAIQNAAEVAASEAKKQTAEAVKQTAETIKQTSYAKNIVKSTREAAKAAKNTARNTHQIKKTLNQYK